MRTQLTAFALALTLVAVVAGPQTGTRSDSGQSASITGTVIRHGTTELVEGAAVVLIDDLGLGPNRSVMTTASGAFTFAGLRAGRYELAVTKAGFVRGAWGADKPERIGRPIVLAADQHLDDLRVPIFVGAVVAGTLWSPDNRPVARARVSALRKRYLSGNRTTIAAESSATTDDRGRFRIFGLPPGDYTIAALPIWIGASTNQMPPTFFPGTSRFDAAQHVHLEMGDERLDTDIRQIATPTGSLRIQVRSADDTDLSGRRVQVSVGPDDELAGVYGARTLTGTDVFVADLPPGPYRIFASAASAPAAFPETTVAPLSGSVVVEISGPGQRQEAVVVVIKRVARISGSVKIRSNATPPRTNVGSTRVWLAAVETTADRRRYDTPNVITQFTLAAIPPGRYQINALATVAGGALQSWTLRAVTRDGQPLEGRSLDVGTDDVTGLDLTLDDDLAVFSGSLLTSDGRATPPHFIVLIATQTDVTGAIAAYYGRPAIDGSFRIADVLEGEYVVAVVEDARPDDLNNPELLTRLRQSSVMTLTFAAGEEKRQNLQTRDPHLAGGGDPGVRRQGQTQGSDPQV